MALRKIDLMHQLFGPGEGTCANCSNCRSEFYHDRTFTKCAVYGLTHSTATDWKKSNIACGMKNRVWDGIWIVKTVTHDRKTPEEIPGQMSLFEVAP